MSAENTSSDEQVVRVLNPAASSPVVLVCEHASASIPPEFDGLGLDEVDLQSHVVWDPGALGVAEAMAEALDAKLIYSKVSRLVYDCNRPPDAPDAMPSKSEIFDIPGNIGLDAAARAKRVEAYYAPFRDRVASEIAAAPQPILVTVHSFTPIYHGVQRDVEIGLLHDADARLAQAMLDRVGTHTPLDVRLNQPYGAEHGVTHTLKVHGVQNGHLNLMLEIRNDLIATADQQIAMAKMLSGWLVEAFVALKPQGSVA